MFRRVITTMAMAAVSGTVLLVAGQQSGPMKSDMTKSDMKMKSEPKLTKAQKIANALSAAPASITAKAAILDWPATDGMAPEVLRPGTNGWSCFPDLPLTAGNAPMCVDDQWMNWLQAYIAKKNPQITKLGIGYMMAPGGEWGSNSDPHATMETKDNHWGQHAPHLMILVPDAKALAGIPTDPKNGGPYVMWAGTPYAHIMAPTSAASMKK